MALRAVLSLVCDGIIWVPLGIAHIYVITVKSLIWAIEARCLVENEDLVGAAPTGDAPARSEWSTILLPTKARLLLEVSRGIIIIECIIMYFVEDVLR